MIALDDEIAFKAAIVGAWFALFFVAERLKAYASPPSTRARLWRNGALWAINSVASPLIVLPLAAWASAHTLWERPAQFNVAALILDVVLLDLWTYWVHRAYHSFAPLWRFHEVHHRDEFLDSTSAVRFHFGEVICSALLRMAPVVLLAIPFSHIVLFEAILLMAAIFQHSNLTLPRLWERAASAVVITPSIHWVHHHAQPADTNSNFGLFLSLWDRLFLTKSTTERTPDLKIGVEGAEDKPILDLILMPIRRSRACMD